MQNTSKHTPGPWHAYALRHADKSPVYGYQIRDAAHNILATLAEYGMHAGAPLSPVTREANAAFIVRACNAHDDLVAALEMLVKWGAASGLGNSPRSKQWTMFESARATLAKAKGES